MITNAPCYVSNLTLHEDLKIPYVREVVFDKYAKHHQKLEVHPNPLLNLLLDIGQPRRLKRTRPMDLLWGRRGSVDGRGIIMSLGGLQYTPSVSILAYRICKILNANLVKIHLKKYVRGMSFILRELPNDDSFGIETCSDTEWRSLYIYIYIYIQGVTVGTDQTSGGCSLC